MSETWTRTTDRRPAEDEVVDVIGPTGGNVHRLVYSSGLWFLPDRSMYVYYTPSHWREVGT